MLSATELASIYGLYTVSGNPNGLLVSQILSDFVHDTNLNVSEYYYVHGHGVMRVYPKLVYEEALGNFVFDLRQGEQAIYVVKSEKKKINFVYNEPQIGNKIIQYGKRKENNPCQKK